MRIITNQSVWSQINYDIKVHIQWRPLFDKTENGQSREDLFHFLHFNTKKLWKRKESQITLVQMNETIIISSTLNTGDSQVSYISLNIMFCVFYVIKGSIEKL
jgi:hypothetical protein